MICLFSNRIAFVVKFFLRSLLILNINPLTNEEFANILSYSVGGLCSVIPAQKLLNFIQSYESIFAFVSCVLESYLKNHAYTDVLWYVS
jgi:hypothetical protein